MLLQWVKLSLDKLPDTRYPVLSHRHGINEDSFVCCSRPDHTEAGDGTVLGFTRSVPASLFCTDGLCPLFNGWIELRPPLKVWLRHTLDRCYAAVLGLCRLQILCGQAGLWVTDSQNPSLPFEASCWPMRVLMAFPSLCRVYQQSLSPRQLSSVLSADLLRVYTEKRSQLCHSLSMKKSSVVFFLWSLRGISDLELLENQQPSP